MDPSKVDSDSDSGDRPMNKAAVDAVIKKAASLYAAAEKALKKCGSVRRLQVSEELFSVPEEMLKAEIMELHKYQYSDAKPPPSTEKDILLRAIQRLEESVEKKDEEIKLLVELLRRSQGRLRGGCEHALKNNGLRALQNNYHEMLEGYKQAKLELGHARCAHAKIREDYLNYLQNLSIMISELSSEITGGVYSVQKGHEPKKQRKS